jgi:DNA-binding transcriptional LysR family regulator
MDLLAQMQTFVHVVEAGSLSAAARAGRLSLPAVSRQLSSLERELGVALIARSTRRLHVTAAGRSWYEHCVRILRDVEDARDAIGRSRALRGQLTVSASFTYALCHVLPRLSALNGRHPELRIDLRLEDQMVSLVGEGVDVAVRAGVPPPQSTSFIAHLLAQFRRVAVATPGYLRRHGKPRSPGELSRRECLVQLGSQGPLTTWSFERGSELEQVQVQVRGALRVSAPIAVRELARAGLGVALLPEWLVQEDLKQQRLVRLLEDFQTPLLSAWAIHRTELRGVARVRALISALRDETAESALAGQMRSEQPSIG